MLDWLEADFGDQDEIPLDLDWDGYRADERSGLFKGITCRKDGRLIGYNAVTLFRPRRHRRTLFALSDAIYFAREERGWAVVRMVRETERILHLAYPMEHTIKMLYGSPRNERWGRLLQKLGYAPIETTYARVLRT